MRKGNLLNTNETKNAIQEELKKTENKIVILSAYVSNTINWIESNLNSHLKKTLIIRGRLSDFQHGASRLEDIEVAIKNGWEIGFLDSLHAKIFIFDDKSIILGSSNMTKNGLALYGAGNLEFSNRINAERKDLAVINKIIKTANYLTLEHIVIMKKVLKDNISSNHWPVNQMILEAPLVVSDMLWQSPLSQNQDSTLKQHDLDILRVDDISVESVQKSLTTTKVFNWLYQKVKESNNNELYYGYITEMLHTELSVEMPIYRKRIKESLSILFDYIRYSNLPNIEIDRPRYSERIRLITDHVFLC